jgi:ABC-2 type transport system ATP-binding protein
MHGATAGTATTTQRATVQGPAARTVATPAGPAAGTGPAASRAGAGPAIRVDGLTKKFGDFTAVDAISFDVRYGEIFGFLGPNGAGKTTTIRMLATLMPPSSGRAVLNGFDVVHQQVKVRESIGLVFQDNSLDDRLSANENLYFHALMYDMPAAEFEPRVREVLSMVDLLDRRHAIVRTFSGGMRRRLEIARGLLHHPAVLFLDEPTVGLDPQTRAAIWEHVKRLRDGFGVTVFMTTHYMDEAENCDRIAIIDHGHIVALGSPEELKASVGEDIMSVGAADPQALAPAIAARYGVEVSQGPDGLRFDVKDGAAFIPRLTADFPGQIRSVSVHRPTLDDVFLQLTGRAIRDEEASGLDQMRMHARAWGGGRR